MGTSVEQTTQDGKKGRSTKLVKNTVIYFIGSFSTKLLVFLLLPLYTNYLDPADYGLVDTYVNLLGIFYSIVSLQAIECVFRFAQDTKSQDDVAVVFSNSAIIALTGYAAYAVIMIVFGAVTGFAYTGIFLLYVFGSIFCQFYLQLLRGLKKNIMYAVMGVVSTFLQLCLNITQIVILGRGAEAILYSSATAYCVVIAILFVTQKTYRLFSPKKIKLSIIKEYLSYSIPLIPNAVCIWALASIGRYVLLLGYGTYEVGLFSYASKFSQILGVVNSVFFMAWQQTAIEMRYSEDKNEYASNVLTAYIKLQFSALLVILPLIKVFVFTIMGSEYAEAWVYVPILFGGILFSAYAHFYAVGFYMEKKTATVFIASFSGFLSYAVFGYIFSQFNAIGGVGLGYVLSQGVYFLIMKKRVEKFLKPKVYVKHVTPCWCCTALFVLLYYVLSWQLNGLVCLVGAVIFFVLNRDYLRSLLKPLLKRILNK